MKGKVIYGQHGKPNKYFIDGKEVTAKAYHKAFPGVKLVLSKRMPKSIKPKLSDALAVHPSQIKEAAERDRKHGVPTEYSADGRPIITSRYHQKQLIKSLGYFNKDAGFGD